MSEGGQFPPRSVADVDAYDDAEIMAGYLEWQKSDPEPGPNRSPGYRWGWANRACDHGAKDGHDHVRAQLAKRYIVGTRRFAYA